MVSMNKNENYDKIKNLTIEQINTIMNMKYPELDLILRGKNNVSFNKRTRTIEIGNKKEVRTYKNLPQIKKYLQTIAVLNELKKNINSGHTMSIRNLFYKLKYSLGDNVDEQMFEEQSESNNVALDAELMLNTTRENLNLVTDPKGEVAGKILIEDYINKTDKYLIDISKQGSSGWNTPSNVDSPKLNIKKVDADYIIIVEKHAIWNSLNEMKFWEKNHCIIASGKGSPSRGFRRFINRLHYEYKLPVYILVDGDPYGTQIALTYKYGSFNIAHINKYLAIPDAKYIGMFLTDIERYPLLSFLKEKKMYLTMKDVDIKKSKDLLQYEWVKINPKLKGIVEEYLKTNHKIEADALGGRDAEDLGKYITEKIKKKDWIE